MSEKVTALVLFSEVGLAEIALAEAGFSESAGVRSSEVGHYETTLSNVKMGGGLKMALPTIRSLHDDKELLGDIAKQLVIAGVPFRTIRV